MPSLYPGVSDSAGLHTFFGVYFNVSLNYLKHDQVASPSLALSSERRANSVPKRKSRRYKRFIGNVKPVFGHVVTIVYFIVAGVTRTPHRHLHFCTTVHIERENWVFCIGNNSRMTYSSSCVHMLGVPAATCEGVAMRYNCEEGSCMCVVIVCICVCVKSTFALVHTLSYPQSPAIAYSRTVTAAFPHRRSANG